MGKLFDVPIDVPYPTKQNSVWKVQIFGDFKPQKAYYVSIMNKRAL